MGMLVFARFLGSKAWQDEIYIHTILTYANCLNIGPYMPRSVETSASAG